MQKILLFIVILLVGIPQNAQTDSTKVLTYKDYLAAIVLEHPLAKQAQLQQNLAQAQELKAKGGFEPLLQSDWSQKQFDNKNYYRIFSTDVSLPTYYGLTLNASYQNNNGDFLNPQANTTGQGLWAMGIEANLLQGLLIDERRAELKKAQVFNNLASAQQQKMINQLLFDASKTYIEWQKIEEYILVIQENLAVAQDYYQFTKESYLGGEYPAIDTLEAFMILQDRQALLQKNQLDLIKAKQNLENHLWYDQLPLQLQDNVQPQKMQDNRLITNNTINQEQNINNNPEIQAKELKRQMLQIDERLKRDKLKPKLKVKYNPLLSTTNENITPNFLVDNLTWGINFSFPIFQRAARADAEMARLKINEIDFELQAKKQSLQNKIEANQQQQQILNQQLSLQNQLVNNANRMLDGEQTRFRYGESSVFLLNKRQEKLLQSQLKEIETQAKLYQTQVEYLYLTNTFYNQTR